MKYARFAGTGAYLPPHVMTNADLAERIDTTDAWIIERTGIKQRHIAGPEETAASMAEEAAQKALTSAQLSPDDIDFIIVATTTPDCIFPSVACLLQKRLKIKSQCPALDLVAACTGFMYGLSIANQYIKAGIAKNVLLVASEMMSRLVNWDDRRTCILFGDGAGAVILQASDTPGICSMHLHADGQYEELLWMENPLFSRKKGIDAYIQMQGSEVFRLAVNHLSKSVDEVLQANHIEASAIDWLLPHQANIRIIQAIAKKLHLPMEKVILTLSQQGNTSAASIPLALDTAIKRGQIKRGDTLLLEAFGAGLTWGSGLIVY